MCRVEKNMSPLMMKTYCQKQEVIRMTSFMTEESMHTRRDPYPTRLKLPPKERWMQRREPVIGGVADDGPLTQDQLQEFENKGFIFEPDFLTPEEVKTLSSELEKLIAEERFREREFSITEPRSQQIRSLFAVHFLSKAIARLAQDKRLVDRARQILGGEPYIHQSRVNYKPAFEGKGFTWHSDFETW